ncbi:hypothetical protein [Streptomyces sp. TR02-1]|uniref:hypothetical protein n=1 Tax=Streptomyces sp. TR02-1 TaxID=3385977 RepID=UPI0039A378AE
MRTAGRQKLLRALAAVAVLGTVGGLATFTGATVDAADRTAPTRVWDAPDRAPSVDDPAPDLTRGRKDEPLSKELLPVPSAFRLGPDIDGIGNDVHLTGKQAEEQMRRSAALLPAQQRKQHRASLKKLDVKGAAMRSYTRYSDDLVVEIRLSQMGNRSAVKDLAAVQSALGEALSPLRKGPEIKGYDNASCFLMPKSDAADDERIEEMFCTAYEDDVLVSLSATGSASYQGTTHVRREGGKLLRKQLERLTEGGGISA